MVVKRRADGTHRVTPMSDAYKVRNAVVPEHWRLLDVVVLKFNENHGREYREAHERRMQYQAWLHKLHTYAEDGKIAIMESGMDCDCVQYEGRVHIVDATKEAVRSEIDSILEWADGPAYFSLERPSVAEGIPYRSRDRAMEAYEDGHPHHVTYGSMDD